MQAVNTDADFLTRHAAQMPSRFHHTAKILLTASPVGTLMTTAVDRAAVGHVVASTHGLLGSIIQLRPSRTGLRADSTSAVAGRTTTRICAAWCIVLGT